MTARSVVTLRIRDDGADSRYAAQLAPMSHDRSRNMYHHQLGAKRRQRAVSERLWSIGSKWVTRRLNHRDAGDNMFSPAEWSRVNVAKPVGG